MSLDQKIQLGTLIILSLTLATTIYYEILKRKKEIKFLSIKVSSNNHRLPNDWLSVEFLCSGRKLIKGISGEEVQTFSKLIFEVGRGSIDNLEEGDTDQMSWYCRNQEVKLLDVKKVVLIDSELKKYIGYCQNGKFVGFWAYYFFYPLILIRRI